jgi:hypothetical protein
MPKLAQLITLAMANQKNSAMTEKRSPEGPKLITNQIELFIASFAPTSIQMIFFEMGQIVTFRCQTLYGSYTEY